MTAKSWPAAVNSLILIAVLLVKPSGLFGERVAEKA